MSDMDNVPVVPMGDAFISVADVCLQAHAGIVVVMQEGKGMITLTDAALDALCTKWLKHRLSAEESAA